MDINYLMNKIYPQNKEHEEMLKIQAGEYIPIEIIYMLYDASYTIKQECFAASDPKKPYTVEIICLDCGKKITKKIGKNALFDYFRKTKIDDTKIVVKENILDLSNFYCDKCKQKFINQKEHDKISFFKKMKQEIKINTDSYINLYLNPNKDWPQESTWKDRVSCVINTQHGIDDDIISKYINQMEYKDFLKTLYWSAISMHKKYKTQYKCSICGGTKNLSTHHNTYKRHGYEHLNDVINKDLIVLCQDCHAKFHNKLPKHP